MKKQSVGWIGLLLAAAITSDAVFGAPVMTVRKIRDASAGCGDVLSHFINDKYPLTDPAPQADGSVKYRIAMISDLDQKATRPGGDAWSSYFKQGHLTYDRLGNAVTVQWDSAAGDGTEFSSSISVKGRGSELSELVTYNGQLVTVDDKTGLVYAIEGDVLIPLAVVVEGDGRQNGFMKNEWATVKDSKLYVGSHGTEVISWGGANGTITVDDKLMWVKTIDEFGGVRHIDWRDNYAKVRAAAGIHFPGYMVHESCVWSAVHGRWFFLPRKASKTAYDEATYDTASTNLLLTASQDFAGDIEVTEIGAVVPERGYASFKFVPGTNDTVIAAICSSEVGENTATHITVFDIRGNIVYPQTKVSDLKFEGLEFI